MRWVWQNLSLDPISGQGEQVCTLNNLNRAISPFERDLLVTFRSRKVTGNARRNVRKFLYIMVGTI